MELIYTYIHNYKGLLELSLPTSSKFQFNKSNEILEINRMDMSKDYYADIPCTLILGKNGVGKTSILDFINSFVYDFEGSGYCIWHENNQFIIITSNFPPPKIKTEMSVEYYENTENFFRMHRLSLIKINNTIDLKSMILGRKKRRNSLLSKDHSLSYFLQGSKSRSKNLLKQLITFAENSNWARNHLPNLSMKFQFEIEYSPTNKVKSILKSNEIGDKGLYGAVTYFNETLYEKVLQQKVTPLIVHDLESLDYSLDNILHDEVSFDEYEIASLIFNKDRSLLIHGDFSFINLITTILMPTIIWSLLKLSRLPKETCETIYLLCLCIIYLEEANPVSTITNVMRDLTTKEIPIKKMEYHWHKILTELQYIVEILEKNNPQRPSELSYTLDDPTNILSLIKHVDNLPSDISARFRYGWDSLSSGEFAKINLFNQIYQSLEQSNSKNIIILLDECDLYLHPEWQRIILSELLNLVSDLKSQKNIQLLITTHSPILASDFLPSDVIYLERDDTHTYTKDIAFGFGATISELYINGFFIKATIGQHAYNYLNKIIETSKKDDLDSSQQTIITQIKNELFLNLINGNLADNDHIKSAINSRTKNDTDK